MKTSLREELVAMLKRDMETRDRLVREGTLFDGYHPEMEAVHNYNAERLAAIIEAQGWPGREEVGDYGLEAAWMILQHAISKPAFQKKCLQILKSEVGSVPLKYLAHLEDRICVFEGRPQIYGTHFDWDSNGKMNPNPIAQPEKVNELRAKVGLPPLQEAIDRMRARATHERERPPKDFQSRQKAFLEWAKKVGWRK